MRLLLAALPVLLATGAVASSACGGGAQTQTATSTGGAGGGGGGEPTTTTSSTTTTTTTTVIDAGPDVDNGMVSTTYPASHFVAPQIAWSGGPVLASPKLVPVFFANEDAFMQMQLTDYVSKIGGTQYFAAATAEYGISPAVSLSPVILTETAPDQIDDTDIQTWLAGKLNADDPAWPAPDANTVYLLHYPEGTGVTQHTSVGVLLACQNFGGYHNSTPLDVAHASMDVAYAVLPRCATFYPATAPGTKQTKYIGIDAATGIESHEILEAVTDPFPLVNPTYVEPDQNHIYWDLVVGGGEVGDMCQSFPHAFNKFVELPYLVQRTWSNQAAAAGKDPCVPPMPGEVYFNSAPFLKDSIKVPGLGYVKGVKIAVGNTATVEIDLFSEADTGGPWNVSVMDVGTPQTLDLSLDRDSGQNGEKLHLTITVNAKNPNGYAPFQLMSTLGQTTTLWYGAVGYQ